MLHGARELWSFETAQLFVFALLVARFYWGTYRFNQEAREHPKDVTALQIMLNAGGTILLFGLFFAVSTLVTRGSDFYLSILVLHVTDFTWFALFQVVTVREGAVPPMLRSAAWWFIDWDILTVWLYAITLAAIRVDILDQASAQAVFLGGLMLITAGDWYVLRDFYASNSSSAEASVA